MFVCECCGQYTVLRRAAAVRLDPRRGPCLTLGPWGPWAPSRLPTASAAHLNGAEPQMSSHADADADKKLEKVSAPHQYSWDYTANNDSINI